MTTSFFMAAAACMMVLEAVAADRVLPPSDPGFSGKISINSKDSTLKQLQ